MLGVFPAIVAAAAVTTKKPKQLPNVGEFVRLVDPVTESWVVRLTALSSASRFPEPNRRFVSSAKDRFLVFSSNRGGSFEPYHLDLRSGSLQLLAEGGQVDPLSLCLDESERSLLYLDGQTVKEVGLSGRRTRTLAYGAAQFVIGSSASELFVRRGSRLERPEGGLVAEGVTRLHMAHPGGTGCVFERALDDGGSELWYAPTGDGKRKLLAHGRISFPFWSPEGDAVCFLREVEGERSKLMEIRQVELDNCLEQTISPTSQFACFAPNRNGSVFVGASGSKAQPTIVLLLRSVKRETTLCEHHASQASAVMPVFSPDSRRVYFESDREGKPALYSVNVELLVEPT